MFDAGNWLVRRGLGERFAAAKIRQASVRVHQPSGERTVECGLTRVLGWWGSLVFGRKRNDANESFS